jgi:hypothetical protein
MLDIVDKRLHAEGGKMDSVTAGYCARHSARDAASRLLAARFLASALADAFGATLYFAALHYIAVYLRFSLGGIKALSSWVRRS